NFIPQIPAFFIQALSRPGHTVLDPFSGSGTTGVEALRLRRDAICGDPISASVFLTSQKLASLLHPLSHKIRMEVSARLFWDRLSVTSEVGANGEGSDPRLSEWDSGSTLGQLRYIS